MVRRICLSCWLALAVAGCTTRNRAHADAKAAFAAGQEQAWRDYQQAHPNSVRFVGPVREPVVEWTETLTLAEAIIVADYRDARDPRVIVVHRKGAAIPVELKQLLAGEDMSLEPGDVIEIHP